MPAYPNILFLFPDQWRWDYLGCHDGSSTPYGNAPVRTPNLNALAQRGTRFTQCRTNSPVCSPARACLAQGRRYPHCGVSDNHQSTPTPPDAQPTVFRLLRDAGYHTMTCGKSDLFKPDPTENPSGYLPVMDHLGFADGIDHRGKGDAVHRARHGIAEPYTLMLRERGLLQTHLDDHPDAILQRPARPTPLPDDAHTDAFATQNALSLLQRAPADHPWLLWVNFPGPHDPYDPPADVLATYPNAAFPPPVNPQPNAPAHRDAAVDRPHYAASCTYLDTLIGQIFDALAQRGELDRTLIVFASDHGDMLGDHGRWTKQVPHESSVRVPLILAGPGVPTATVQHELVELIDISATLLTVAGLDIPPHWDAQPLPLPGPVPLPPRRYTHSALNHWQSITTLTHKLVIEDDQPTHLFDLQAEPAEQHNVIEHDPQTAEHLQTFLPA
ncbi:MAG: sulfatase-like hydrolase/transferase [Planctomycetota bacterium]